ncbi:MAG: 2-heptaprenyl,4-naphthoquinone methyltransferase MenG [Segetibacter sp.]|nr:2-heptaprenyl,4-naphthoquinone methyltransferase MenG [Segetibacter sp.]
MAKYAHDTIVPFKESNQSKKQQVAAMFDKIAFRYDFLNRFLSAGIDVSWRKKAIKQLQSIQPKYILDVATGTGDVAILTQKIMHPTKITGIDISEGMLEIGKKKIEKLGLQNEIELLQGDSETLSFPDSSFDAITVAFGVRNFQNLEKGLAEMLRVLKPGGKLVVLEFSRPKQFLFKAVYNLYMNTIAPGFGKLIAKNKDAYQYLNDSVQRFPEGHQFIDILKNTGYSSTYSKILTLGICTVYCGSK